MAILIAYALSMSFDGAALDNHECLAPVQRGLLVVLLILSGGYLGQEVSQVRDSYY